MKRWFFFALALVIIAGSVATVVGLRVRTTSASSAASSFKPHIHLTRTPNSAYKYHLCTEAYAYMLASADNPYKTDYTFHDPFRNANDTIIPRFLGTDTGDNSLGFSVKVILNQVATFNESILHVHELDGISVQLPDKHNQIQRSSVPQFIISGVSGKGKNAVVVLDYTCPEQWVWSITTRV